MQKIYRSKGFNDSEKILYKICDKTFFKLWAFANPFRNDGKELCDLLVVFEKSVLVFSVKDIKFNKKTDVSIAWKRWKKKAIDKSIEQVEAAVKWLKNNPNKVYLDSKCEVALPVIIPKEGVKYYSIVVANGSEEACKEFSVDNINGSIGIIYSKDVFYSNNCSSPFVVRLSSNEGLIHVFDSYTLNVILGELDTITDLVNYLETKEEAILKLFELMYCGEEDLLAHYYSSFDEKNGCYNILPLKEKGPVLMIPEGCWNSFINIEQYINKKEDDKKSKFWDNLFHRVFEEAIEDRLIGDFDIFKDEQFFQPIVKEPRIARRLFYKLITDAIKEFPKLNSNFIVKLIAFPSFFPDIMYVFLQTWLGDTANCSVEYCEETQRSVRKYYLEVACGVIANKFPKIKKVIGIAIYAPKYVVGNSEDFYFFDCEKMDYNELKEYEILGKELKILQNENINFYRIDEFPI